MAHGEGSTSLPAVSCTSHLPVRGRGVAASGLMLQPETTVVPYRKSRVYHACGLKPEIFCFAILKKKKKKCLLQGS